MKMNGLNHVDLNFERHQDTVYQDQDFGILVNEDMFLPLS